MLQTENIIVTRILKLDPQRPDRKLVEQAAKIIREGGLVAFPTETVYGLGADALSDEAVRLIYKAKGRPPDNPLIVHIATLRQLGVVAKRVPEKAKILMRKFWPGPLTLVLEKKEVVPDVTTAGLDTVGVRMPNHPIAKLLIQQAGTPIAAPSANISGSPSPTKFEHVFRDLFGKVHLIINGGDTPLGVESTVVDTTVEPPAVLRLGAIPIEAIKRLIGDIVVHKPNEEGMPEPEGAPKSPGLKYKHYAPKTKMIVVQGPLNRVQSEVTRLIQDLTASGLKVGLLALRGTYEHSIVRRAGNWTLKSIAKDLYSSLRDLDNMNLDIIIAEGIMEKGLGLTIMDRLKRASGGNVIRVS